jgi:TRAP transporter TAXI family solute receptor
MRLKNIFTLFLGIILSATTLFGQMIILSGPSQGTYKAIVDDIVELSNSDSNEIFINVVSDGSGFNYDELIDPDSPVKIAVIQSDYLYYKEIEDAKNNTEKSEAIEILVPLANEQIHIVTKKSNNLTKLADLKGVIVGCGTEEQGTYATAILIKNKSEVFWNTKILDFDRALKALYGDQIAAFFVVGTAPLKKLDLNPQAIVDPIALISPENINDWAHYHKSDVIKSTNYKWLDYDVPTYSVKNLLVVNKDKLTEEDKVILLELLNNMKNNLSTLQSTGHPAWLEIDFYDWDSSDWPIYSFE